MYSRRKKYRYQTKTISPWTFCIQIYTTSRTWLALITNNNWHSRERYSLKLQMVPEFENHLSVSDNQKPFTVCENTFLLGVNPLWVKKKTSYTSKITYTLCSSYLSCIRIYGFAQSSFKSSTSQVSPTKNYYKIVLKWLTYGFLNKMDCWTVRPSFQSGVYISRWL